MRLLRQSVLEDDHRGDGRLLLDVGDVVALDAERQAFEVEPLPKLLERLDPAKPLLLGRRGLRLQREPRVLGRELLKTPLLAALGRANLDPRAAALGEELRERGRVPRSRGTMICGGTLGAEP